MVNATYLARTLNKIVDEYAYPVIGLQSSIDLNLIKLILSVESPTVDEHNNNINTDDPEIIKSVNKDPANNTKRSHTQLDSRKQVIAFQDRVMTINIKEAQHLLKREKQVIDKSSIMLKISTKSMHRVLV